MILEKFTGKKINKDLQKKYIKTQKQYRNALRVISHKGKIRIGFFVIYDSVFSFRELYKLFSEDPRFEPFIVVIPDILHNKNEMVFEQLKKTYDTLKKEFECVYLSFDKKTDSWIDFCKQVDLVCIDNRYDCLTYSFYTIEYLAQQGIPTFFTAYGYDVSNWHLSIIDGEEFKNLWRYFVLTEMDLKDYKRISSIHVNNARLYGYPKMDNYYNISERNNSIRIRKKIIIAPHHTIVEGEDLCFSNFLRYADFYLKLPELYPNIDFVFRPHPLLKAQLLSNNIWSQKTIDDYFDKMEQFDNVEYQDGGDYFDTFAQSDGIIHDCGSFMAEYLFTGNPACYCLKDEEINKKNYCAFGIECINNHYKAFNEEDIVSFIENVVINGNDPLKKARKDFLEKKLMYTYPRCNEKIYRYIKRCIRLWFISEYI